MPLDKTRTLNAAPSSDGVYMMLNDAGSVLYVGKAKSIKQRLRSYFSARASHKTKKLIAESTQFKTIVTHTETEALLLEDQLIKKHSPRFNVLLRDDKSYPYLWFSPDDFSQLTFRHRKYSKKGTYFGPYISKHSLRITLDLLERTFQLRTCSAAVFKNRTQPCLKYQINCCSAPCVGLIDQATYRQKIKMAQRFLRNADYAIINTLTSQMQTAAQAEQFEQAATLRDTITQLRSIQQEHSQAIVTNEAEVDAWGIYTLGGKAFVQLVQVRSGAVRATLSFGSDEIAQTNNLTLLPLLHQYYLSLPAHELVKTILVPKQLPEHAMLLSGITVVAHKKIHISSGSKNTLFVKWLALAHNNALLAAEHASQKSKQLQSHFVALAEKVGLHEINTIECFDVSHMTGQHTVCAMTLCTTNGLQTGCYKNFMIKHATKQDDYAATKEAISRRMAYASASTTPKATKDVYLPHLPDLLVIDGGIGHIRAALAALAAQGIANLTLLGIAKGPTRKAHNERYYLCRWHGDAPATTPIIEIDLTPVPFVIQLVRDQAHNRAINAMRRSMQKSIGSNLVQLKGIGSKRQQQLLLYFKSRERLMQASLQNIAKVPGIGKQLASAIHAQLANHVT